MMITKIHIDIKQGIVSAEGDSNFVREVYSDYKDKLLEEISQSALSQEKQVPEPSLKHASSATKKRRQRSHSKTPTNIESNGTDPKKPKLDSNLDTSDLEEFYNQFGAVKNNSEAILIFAKYLIEKRKIEIPNTDQIYTCFREVKRQIPEVFSQAFRDTKSNRAGYIDYESLKKGITVTIKGDNHFDKMQKRERSTK